MRGNQSAGTKKPALHGHKVRPTRKSISSAKADKESLERVLIVVVIPVQKIDSTGRKQREEMLALKKTPAPEAGSRHKLWWSQ